MCRLGDGGGSGGDGGGDGSDGDAGRYCLSLSNTQTDIQIDSSTLTCLPSIHP